MVLNPSFWAGRRVLLTGHTGFTGAWAAHWLTRLGAQVSGLALPPETEPNLYTLLGAWGGLHSHLGDLNDAAAVREFIGQADPEIVLHMAAQALVSRSYREPVRTWQTNVIGTINLLEALRSCRRVRAVLVVTSDKVYENSDRGQPFTEADKLGGHDPYSGSKAATEMIVVAWRRSFFRDGPPLATARAGNVIGGGDWAADRLVPDLVRAVMADRPLELRNPKATRPWQYVLEPIAGYLTYIERLAFGKMVPPALNFGPATEDVRSVEKIVERLLDGFGRPGAWVHRPMPAMPETQALVLDATLATRSLGWRPRLGIDAALDWTLEWYAAWREGEDPRALTDAQIERYEALSS